MFIINEHTLERLVCCQCKKYLSVKPIKVYPNRGIKCGRCSDDNDAGVVSYFGILADHALFPCINRFDGCGQLLKFSEVGHHEEKCLPKEYECPICVGTFKSSSYYIYHHFKDVHLEAFLLNNSEFTIDIDQELYNSYLYCKNNLLFFIVIQYIHAEQLLKFTTQFLGDNCDRITQSFKLYSLDRKVKYTSRKKPCYLATSGGDVEWFQVKLKEKDFDKRMVICRFNLDTEQAEGLQRLPESIKAFSNIFQFQCKKNVTIPLPNQMQSTKRTMQTLTERNTPKESIKETNIPIESLEGLSGMSTKSGHTSTVIYTPTTTSMSLFSNSNESTMFGFNASKVAAATSTITTLSLVSSNAPLSPACSLFTQSPFIVTSTASSVIPYMTTQVSSNEAAFGPTHGTTTSFLNRNPFAPMKSSLGFPDGAVLKGKSKSTTLQ